MTLVLIGGGEISKGELIRIDKEIIKKGRGEEKLVLFFPTAANDSEGYSEQFKKYYSSLGCTDIRAIKILDKDFNPEALRKLLNNTGIIYLGGGDTHSLIKSMKDSGVDMILKEAIKKKIVIAGMSAGAIALGEITNSEKKEKEFIKAWGVVKGYAIEAHFTESRKEEALCNLLDYGKKGIGIDERTAVIIEGNTAKVIGEGNVFLFNKKKQILREGDCFEL